jgi:hypothetical protein
MLKLLNILQEGAIQLTSDERSQVEKLLPKLIKTISGKYIGDNKRSYVEDINAISADKTPIKVTVYVGNDLNNKGANGYYTANDKNNPEDNEILIQQFYFSPYFTGLSGLDTKLTKIATGNENLGIEMLRKVLKHELIHAKDPAINQHSNNEPYNSDSTESYYKSWAEFQTMTGQFFEAITTGVDRALQLKMPKEKILGALKNIIEFYSGKSKTFTQDTKDFIQGTGKRNVFQSLFNFAAGNLPSAIDDYYGYIEMIRKHNPKGYKEFLSDLYKTVDQAKDKLNNLKEMKQKINEIKRMQLLAGIITEAEISTDPVADKDAEKGLKAALSMLKSSKNSIKPSPKDGELDESLTLGLIAGAPGLISIIGKAVNFVSNIFKKDKKQGTIVGDALKHWGHQLEEAYIGAIGDILKVAFPKSFGGQDVKDQTSQLYDVAHHAYAVILLGAAISSGMGAAEAHNLIAKGLEGGLSAFKTSEVVALAQKVAAA